MSHYISHWKSIGKKRKCKEWGTESSEYGIPNQSAYIHLSNNSDKPLSLLNHRIRFSLHQFSFSEIESRGIMQSEINPKVPCFSSFSHIFMNFLETWLRLSLILKLKKIFLSPWWKRTQSMCIDFRFFFDLIFIMQRILKRRHSKVSSFLLKTLTSGSGKCELFHFSIIIRFHSNAE